MARYGEVWFGFSGEKFLFGDVRFGAAWHGGAWLGLVGHGKVWFLWREIFMRCGGAGHGPARSGMVGLGMAWSGGVGQGPVRFGEVWFGFSGEKFLYGRARLGKVGSGLVR
jgi:hypothetical protein